MLVIQRQDAQQHQHAADQGVNHELDGRIAAARAAPDGDDEVHGHQHGFPEHEEQQEIERHEDAQHGGLQQQEEGVVFLQALGDGVPAGEDGEEAQQRGEHDQQQAQPVDADVVGGAERGNPGAPLNELEILVRRTGRPAAARPGSRSGLRHWPTV